MWSVAVSSGTPKGAPELIKSEIGQAWSLGVGASGALYLGSRVGGLDVYVASIDFSTGQLLSPPVNPVPSHIGSNTAPQWSRDGKFLAYVSRRDVGSREAVIGIRSMDTGHVREVRPQLNTISYYPATEWSPDGRAFVVQGTDPKGRDGIFRIDAQTGDVSPIVLAQQPDESLGGPKWSPDGSKIYYRRSIPGVTDPAFIERDVVSGADRQIIQRGRGSLAALDLSPDGRWIATVNQNASGGFSTLLVIPVTGGEPRELFRVKIPDRLTYPSWGPDASFVIACKITMPGNEMCEHWQVPLSGGEPRKLNVDLHMSRTNGWISVHPDGRQIAYGSGKNEYEISMIENFLPAATDQATARGARR